MNGCETAQVRISLQLDGMLEPEEERELEAHLANCARCRALKRELEAVHAAFPQLEDCPAPEGFAGGVMERIDALEEKRPKVVPLFRRPQVRALMGLAACAVLCVGLYRGGLLDRNADGLGAVSSQQLDAAGYQVRDGACSGGDEQTGLSDEYGQSADPETGEPGVSIRGSTETEEGNVGTEPGVSSNSAEDTPGVQPSQFQVNPQDKAGCIVAGQEVAAVLTLDRLPQGWEDVLGETPQWLTDETGRTCCIITAGQLQQLQTLARQEETVSAELQGQAEEDQPCALVLLETP